MRYTVLSCTVLDFTWAHMLVQVYLHFKLMVHKNISTISLHLTGKYCNLF